MTHPDITGVILAGGLGRRMGGVDKGLQLLAGKPLVRHVAERLAPQVGKLLINANRSQADYATLGYPVVADSIPDFAGPLAGLHAGLAVADTSWVLTAPCDSPHLPLDLAERLLAGAVATGSGLAIARAEDRVHPVFCLCRRDLRGELEAFLHGGGRRVKQWCEENGVAIVDFDDQPTAFRNFNTLEDLQA